MSRIQFVNRAVADCAQIDPTTMLVLACLCLQNWSQTTAVTNAHLAPFHGRVGRPLSPFDYARFTPQSARSSRVAIRAGSQERRASVCGRRRALRSGSDPLGAHLHSPLHLPARRPQTEASWIHLLPILPQRQVHTRWTEGLQLSTRIFNSQVVASGFCLR